MAAPDARSFSVGFLNWKSLVALVLFGAAVLLSITLALDGAASPFIIAIAAGTAGLILWLLMVGKVTVAEHELIVGGGIYKIRVPWDHIDVEHATLLGPDDTFRLRWRSNGVGWPGCQLGWFTSNRKRKVFAATSGRQGLVCIPTWKDFDVVATPEDPEELLRQMRSHARRPAGAPDRFQRP